MTDDDPLPAAEPVPEPHDPHTGPLDNDDDARYLKENDPRRIEVEAKRGRRLEDDA
jgi:hypothetical protein